MTIRGRVRVNQDEISINGIDISLIDQGTHQKELHIDLEHVEDLSLMKHIQDLGRQYRGPMPLVFHIGDVKIKAHRKFWVSEDALYFSQLEAVLGSGRSWLV